MKRLTRWSLVLVLVPLLAGSKCRDKDDPPPDSDFDIQGPEVLLQLISIDPASAKADQGFDAMLYGSEFAQGMRVFFDEREAVSVTVVDGNTARVTAPGLPPGAIDVTVMNPGGERSVLRSGLIVRGNTQPERKACEEATLYFEFDASSLTPEANRHIAELASCLADARGDVRLEGHCDERGTTTYNIALGNRRAEAVKSALVRRGVSPSRIETVSYGEERPAVGGHDEAAWAKNRRVELELLR